MCFISIYLAKNLIYLIMLLGWSPRIVRDDGVNSRGSSRPNNPLTEKST